MINLTGQGGAPAVTGPSNTEANLKVRRFTSTSDFAIPAGAYFVEVYNSGFSDQEVTINGDKVNLDTRAVFEKKYNEVTGQMDLVPELVIVCNGQEIEYNLTYPSASTVDPNTLG